MHQALANFASSGNYDVCIVGGGPVGIALALGCEEEGLSVLLLESGHFTPDRFATSLTEGHEVEPQVHAAPGVAMCRSFGGTSKWWGGGCTGFDEIDFAKRVHVETNWPISHADVAMWYTKASEFFGIGPANFRAPVEPWSRLEGARFEDLEHWAPEIDSSRVHGTRLAESERITVVLGATVTALRLTDDASRVVGLRVADASDGVDLSPNRVVLACGGLETTRLLLVAQQALPNAFGGPNGALGRYYMGHMSGKIADLVLEEPAASVLHEPFLESGIFVRRHFTLPLEVQKREKLLNIAFWADNPPFHLVEHRNGALSLIWLVLAIPELGRLLLSEGVRISHVGPAPHRWMGHLRNVFGSPMATASMILKILRERIWASPRKPSLLLFSPEGRYALHYHAEQSPDSESRVVLGSRRDALGVPYLNVRLRFCEADARKVVKAHITLDRSLRRSGLGHLKFCDENPRNRVQRVLTQAKDGFHQIGTTRMGADARDSVVDGNCRVHGIENLYVASSAVFASSGQAFPTFPAVALAFRLAAHLGRETSISG